MAVLGDIMSGYIFVFRRVQARRLLDRLERRGVEIKVKDGKFIVPVDGVDQEDKELLALYRAECLSLLHEDPVRVSIGSRLWDQTLVSPNFVNSLLTAKSIQVTLPGDRPQASPLPDPRA
jgi:hypothetical protein